MLLVCITAGVVSAPVCITAEAASTTENNTSEQIAGEDDMAPVQEVGEEGMIPVFAGQLAEGTYPIEVDSSSSMFRIVKAELTVADGEMRAVITLSGKGYLQLFMGTGEEAVGASESDYILYAEDAEGAYTYELPVSALNQALECTSFSKKKEKWYDRQLVFRADTLPEEAFRKVLADGTYLMEVDLTGGSGKASVTSPAQVTVANGIPSALIEFSSSNYDYMLINGMKYLPVNTDGNSTFQIPVAVFDEEMTVIADTVAMSTPHEVEYTLTFHSDTAKAAGVLSTANMIVIVLLIAAVVICVILLTMKMKKGNAKK